MQHLQFIHIDLEKNEHCQKLLHLLNAYMEDDMGIGEPMPEHLGPKILNGLKKHSGYRGFFVADSGKIVALANCNMNFGTFSAKPLLNIHDLIVLPEYRGKGIGRFMLQKLDEYALSNECSKITLEVRDDNMKAQSLYKKAGFSAGKPPYGFWEKSL